MKVFIMPKFIFEQAIDGIEKSSKDGFYLSINNPDDDDKTPIREDSDTFKSMWFYDIDEDIYDEVKDLYCEDNGRPSLDPVVLFKLVFIQALDGLKSMRKTCDKIKVDAEYRWFLNIPFGQDTPHFSTFSKNYERRFKDNDIFERMEQGKIDGRIVIDMRL